MPDDLGKIRRTSSMMRALANILMVFIPLGCVAYWASFNSVGWPMPNALAGLIQKPCDSRMLFTGFIVSCLPCGLLLYAVYQLRQLFGLYRDGQVFTSKNCKYLRHLGYAMLAWLPIGLLFDTMLSVAVTLQNPPGQHYLSVSLHTMDVVVFMIGAVFVVLAWVMGEGARIAEEQAQFV